MNTWNIAATAQFLPADPAQDAGMLFFIPTTDGTVNIASSVYFPFLRIYGNSPCNFNAPANAVISTGNITWEVNCNLNGGKWILTNAIIRTGGTSALFNLVNADVIFSGDSVNYLGQTVTGAGTITNIGNLEWTGGISATADGTILVNYANAWLGDGAMNGYFSNATTIWVAEAILPQTTLSLRQTPSYWHPALFSMFRSH
jgi:hypothetical protein